MPAFRSENGGSSGKVVFPPCPGSPSGKVRAKIQTYTYLLTALVTPSPAIWDLKIHPDPSFPVAWGSPSQTYQPHSGHFSKTELPRTKEASFPPQKFDQTSETRRVNLQLDLIFKFWKIFHRNVFAPSALSHGISVGASTRSLAHACYYALFRGQ